MLRHHRGSVAVAALALAVCGGATAAASGGDRHAEIAFRRFLTPDNSSGAIFVADAHGRHERQVTTPSPGGIDDQPTWTPDGRRIAFGRQPGGDAADTHRELWTVRADGSDPRLLLPACLDGPPRCIPGEQHSGPAYSPDGRQVAYEWGGGEAREDINQIEFSEVFVMNADGSDRHPLTTFSLTHPFDGDTGRASWSPDSRRLVLSHVNSPLSEPPGGTSLFVINRDGSGLPRLTPWELRAGGRGAWFPDGRTIAFRTVPPDGETGGDIYTIRADGTCVRRLTRFPRDIVLGELSISPDGREIVFSKGQGQRDLFVMLADGTHQRQITQTELSENWPAWRPFS